MMTSGDEKIGGGLRYCLVLAVALSVNAWGGERARPVELPDKLVSAIFDVSSEEACAMQLPEVEALQALDLINANRLEQLGENEAQRYRRMLKEGFAKVYCDSRMTNRCVYVFLRTFSCNVTARDFQYDMLELKSNVSADVDVRGRTSEGLTINIGAVWQKESLDRVIRK